MGNKKHSEYPLREAAVLFVIIGFYKLWLCFKFMAI